MLIDEIIFCVSMIEFPFYIHFPLCIMNDDNISPQDSQFKTLNWISNSIAIQMRQTFNRMYSNQQNK